MADTAYIPRLRAEYDRTIRGQLTEKFGYANVMQVPRLDKVVLNMGVGDAVNDRKKAETAAGELTQIAGQKAIVTYSRIAIATFKLRENQPIGCKVTLRKTKMYEFIDRLVNVALPRVRDFRGLNPKSFDGRGNYSLGIKEHIIFPEIDFDKVSEARGMPYISASIIIQLLTTVSPQLEALKKEGEAGRKTLNQYTRYLTVILAAFQSYGIAVGLQGAGNVVSDPGLFFLISTSVTISLRGSSKLTKTLS